MFLAVVFALADLSVGVWLVWYANSGRQRRPEPAAVVGITLLVAAVFLSYVAWKIGHRPPHPSGPGEL